MPVSAFRSTDTDQTRFFQSFLFKQPHPPCLCIYYSLCIFRFRIADLLWVHTHRQHPLFLLRVRFLLLTLDDIEAFHSHTHTHFTVEWRTDDHYFYIFTLFSLLSFLKKMYFTFKSQKQLHTCTGLKHISKVTEWTEQTFPWLLILLHCTLGFFISLSQPLILLVCVPQSQWDSHDRGRWVRKNQPIRDVPLPISCPEWQAFPSHPTEDVRGIA